MRTVGALAVLVSCTGQATGNEIDEILALPADPALGAEVYLARCALCHGDSGEGGSGPALQGEEDEPYELIGVILDGYGTMSGFRETLTEQEIAHLYAYLQQSILPGQATSQGS